MSGGRSQAQVRVHNAVLNSAAIVVLIALAAAAFGGIVDPSDARDRPNWWPGALFVAIPIGLALRGLLVGIVVRESDLLLRGWLRSRRVSRDQVLAVTTTQYSGLWNRGSQSRQFSMLGLTTTTGLVEIPAVAARPDKAKQLASDVRRALDFDP
jgi:hypothetical protein